MQQSGKIRAWGHVNAGESFLDGAGAADSRATLQHQHSLVRPRQIRRAGKAVVPGSDDNYIPAVRGQFTDWSGQSNFAEKGCCRGDHGPSIYFGAPSWEADSHDANQHNVRISDPKGSIVRSTCPCRDESPRAVAARPF